MKLNTWTNLATGEERLRVAPSVFVVRDKTRQCGWAVSAHTALLAARTRESIERCYGRTASYEQLSAGRAL